MKSDLDVTRSFDLQRTNDLQACRTKHLILFITQSLSRGYNDTIARMNSNRIKIFHTTNRDAVICSITNHFKFNFFPASHTSLNQCLLNRTCGKSPLSNFFQGSSITSHTATRSAKCISRTNNHWKSDFLSKSHRSFNCRDNRARWNRFTNFFHLLLK